MGEGTEAALGEQLARLERGDDGRRVPLWTALWHGGRLASELRGAPGVVDVVIAGSARRAAPTVGDLDIVASESRPGAAAEALAASRRVGDPSGRGRMLVDAPLRVELWAGPPAAAPATGCSTRRGPPPTTSAFASARCGRGCRCPSTGS